MSSTKSTRKYLWTAIAILCFTQFLSLSSALEVDMTIKPGEYQVYSVGLNNNDENVLDVYSNGSWNLIFLTADNFTAFVGSISYLAVHNLTGSGEFHTTLAPYVWNISLVLVIRNFGSTDLSIKFKINEGSQFVATVRYLIRFVIIGAFFALSLFFLRRKNELVRSGESDQAEIYKGFFWTYFFVALNYFQSELFPWIKRDAEIQIIPEIEVPGFISFRLDQIIFLLLIIVSDLFMTKQIEQRVGRFKHLYLTYMLISAAIALALPPFLLGVPLLPDILTLYAMGVLLITFMRLFYLYLRIAWDSSGAVRAKSLAIGFGLILPLIAVVLGSNLIPSYPDLSRILMDCVTVFSIYLLYWGLR